KEQGHTCGQRLPYTILDYTDEVACLTVPSTFVLVRDRGVPLICGQTVNFQVPYGSGPDGIARGAKIPLQDARDLLDRYFNLNPSVKAFLDACHRQVEQKGYTATPFGRKRFYQLRGFQGYVQQDLAVRDDPGQTAEWERRCHKYGTQDP